MKCSMCSYEFDEESSKHSCSGCFKLGSCSMVKCPKCGYETPPEPKWLKRLNQRLRKAKEK